jgi:hypothetical protein
MHETRPKAWQATAEVTRETLWVWVTGPSGRDVMRAALPRGGEHPRALVTLREGLALWSGAPLSAVIGVDHPVGDSLGLGFFGNGDRWPEDTALVTFSFRQPARPRRRLGRLRGSEAGARGEQGEA